MNRVILAVMISMIITPTISIAQDITEYGKPEELKGVTKIFVFTGSDMKSREIIIREIEKKQKKGAMPNLRIVERAADAEVMLVYSETTEEYVTGVRTTPNPGTRGSTSTPTYGESDTGVGRVVKLLPDGGSRLLVSFEAEKWLRFQKGPETKFAQAFIKAYMKANGDEKK